jgi:aspartyl protease family protein
MALQRLVLAAAALAVIGVTAPTVAPQLLAAFLAPPAPTEVPHTAPAPVAPPPVIAAPRSPPDVQYGRTVALRADAQGQFAATATIDGRSVPVIVDTGATAVALSADTARRLGIMPPQSAFRLAMSTANGITVAAPVTLNEVRVGSISVRNVAAVVVAGDGLSVNLLGMTFLSRLTQFSVAGSEITLRE